MASQDRVPVLLAPPLLTPPLLAPPVVATPPTPLEEAPPPLVVPPVPFPPVPEPPAFAPPMLAPPLVAAPPLLALPPTLLVLLPPLPPPVEPPMLALPPALSALLLPPVPPAELDAVPPALAPPMLRLPALPLDPPFAALVPPLPVAPPEGEVVDDCGLAHPTPIMAAENMITPNFNQTLEVGDCIVGLQIEQGQAVPNPSYSLLPQEPCPAVIQKFLPPVTSGKSTSAGAAWRRHPLPTRQDQARSPGLMCVEPSGAPGFTRPVGSAAASWQRSSSISLRSLRMTISQRSNTTASPCTISAFVEAVNRLRLPPPPTLRLEFSR